MLPLPSKPDREGGATEGDIKNRSVLHSREDLPVPWRIQVSSILLREADALSGIVLPVCRGSCQSCSLLDLLIAA